jgi:curved DNA-binding protein CbpA
MKEILEAYEVLRDPVTRAEYDSSFRRADTSLFGVSARGDVKVFAKREKRKEIRPTIQELLLIACGRMDDFVRFTLSQGLLCGFTVEHRVSDAQERLEILIFFSFSGMEFTSSQSISGTYHTTLMCCVKFLASADSLQSNACVSQPTR